MSQQRADRKLTLSQRIRAGERRRDKLSERALNTFGDPDKKAALQLRASEVARKVTDLYDKRNQRALRIPATVTTQTLNDPVKQQAFDQAIADRDAADAQAAADRETRRNARQGPRNRSRTTAAGSADNASPTQSDYTVATDGAGSGSFWSNPLVWIAGGALLLFGMNRKGR